MYILLAPAGMDSVAPSVYSPSPPLAGPGHPQRAMLDPER